MTPQVGTVLLAMSPRDLEWPNVRVGTLAKSSGFDMMWAWSARSRKNSRDVFYARRWFIKPGDRTVGRRSRAGAVKGE